MSSAKWQRHSTFLSVRWRTWIGRALMASAFSGERGVRAGWPLATGQAGVPAPADRWRHPHGKRAGFQPATWRRPVSYQAARGQLTAPSATVADRDICEVGGGIMTDGERGQNRSKHRKFRPEYLGNEVGAEMRATTHFNGLASS